MRAASFRTRCGNFATIDEYRVLLAKAARLHEATGVDQLQFLMATETVPHKEVMKSIEMLGKHVIPAFKKQEADEAPRS